ncbi:hypothetical protein [Endozoicomonas sp. Mp262]|uniref:hypothetical protein n=1 Tax=Endozoicomonas sp. Mp262 TaxID=2919499 RepID=UPI0021D88394
MSRGSSIGNAPGTLPSGHQAEPEIPAGQKQPPEPKKYLPHQQQQIQSPLPKKKLAERMTQKAETAQHLPSVQESPFHRLQSQISCSDNLTELQDLYTALEDEPLRK